MIVAYPGNDRLLNDTPVGSVVCNTNYQSKIAHLSMLCVHNDYAGKGLGGILIKAAEKRAKEMGCD